MSEELKVKRSYAIPENEMVIIKDTNTLLHNIVDSELEEKDKEIERLNNIINELEKYCNEEIEDYDKNIKSQYITDITKEQYEGEKVCFEDMLYKIKELKGVDKE